MRLRASEWIYAAYFAYVGALAWIFPLPDDVRWRATAVFAGALVIFGILSLGRTPVLRDWLPVALMLLAYREMNWFTPAHKPGVLERSWVVWDRQLLHDWGLQRAIESLGPVLPGYLEISYALVYAVGFYCVGVLYAENRRDRVEGLLCAYALGGLLSYALFPYFPSDPPRVVFAGTDLPNIVTPMRQLNLYLVNNYGIHSSVFPSAHVSTGFAAGWGLRHAFPERPWYGRAVLIYAASMSVATVYGRYHYAVDAVAGVAISVVAIGMVRTFGLLPGARPAR